MAKLFRTRELSPPQKPFSHPPLGGLIALCIRGSAVRTCYSQNRTLEKVLLIYLLPRNNAIFNPLKTNERADGSQKQ